MLTASETKHIEYNLGVIVGRFQVHELHNAHIDLIQSVLNRHSRVVIFLGVPQQQFTIRNPLPFDARRQMIETRFSRDIDRLSILPLKDKEDNTDWVRLLEDYIDTMLLPNEKPLLYGSRDSFVDIYKGNGGKYDTEELISENAISGTEIRWQASNAIINSVDFRKAVIYTVTKMLNT